MSMKKHKPEQIVALLRHFEVEIANGWSTAQACKESEITVQTYYRWTKEFGRLKLDQARLMKELNASEAFSSGAVAGEADPKGRGLGKLLSPVGGGVVRWIMGAKSTN
jgi:hypothetical protein